MIYNCSLLQIATSLLQNFPRCYISKDIDFQHFIALLQIATNVTYTFSFLKTIFLRCNSIIHARITHKKGGCLATVTPHLNK